MENIDLLPPTVPSLVFTRETYKPYRPVEVGLVFNSFRLLRITISLNTNCNLPVSYSNIAILFSVHIKPAKWFTCGSNTLMLPVGITRHFTADFDPVTVFTLTLR